MGQTLPVVKQNLISLIDYHVVRVAANLAFERLLALVHDHIQVDTERNRSKLVRFRVHTLEQLGREDHREEIRAVEELPERDRCEYNSTLAHT